MLPDPLVVTYFVCKCCLYNIGINYAFYSYLNILVAPLRGSRIDMTLTVQSKPDHLKSRGSSPGAHTVLYVIIMVVDICHGR